jgi:hypothetical protein
MELTPPFGTGIVGIVLRHHQAAIFQVVSVTFVFNATGSVDQIDCQVAGNVGEDLDAVAQSAYDAAIDWLDLQHPELDNKISRISRQVRTG